MNPSISSNEIYPMLRDILVGAELSTFEYWSEFNVRLERDTKKQLTALNHVQSVPPVFHLRLRSDWWIGDRTTWSKLVEDFPIRARRNQPIDGPVKASVVFRMLGSVINDIKLEMDGGLLLMTSDGDNIHVPGRTSLWEESWILEPPNDYPSRENWLIQCESQGEIFGRWPRE